MSARSQKLIRKSDLARMAGVQPNTITGLCKKRLFRACVGTKINLNHQDVQQYLAEREVKLPKEVRHNRDEDPSHVPQEVEEVMDWTLRKILDKYGTKEEFKDILIASAKIEDIASKRLKNAQTKGVLVNRHLIQSFVLDTFESAHMQMLTDGAKKMAAKAVLLVETGENKAAIEREFSKQMSRYLKTAIEKAAKELDELENNIEGED